MKLAGRLIKGTRTIKKAFFENDNSSMAFADALEECLIRLCKEMDIPVPIWMKKNTHEFVAFRKTFFTSEQFAEEINFDKFEITLEQH
ncbi:MAG: hypothetical protein GX754_11255 [Clostridiaceae bacterium]|nr:hypothetical protein [Clostridiaceae bacterium]